MRQILVRVNRVIKGRGGNPLAIDTMNGRHTITTWNGGRRINHPTRMSTRETVLWLDGFEEGTRVRNWKENHS